MRKEETAALLAGVVHILLYAVVLPGWGWLWEPVALLSERTDLIWGRGQKPIPRSVCSKVNKLGRKQLGKSHSSLAWGCSCGWSEWKISGWAINLTISGNERTIQGLDKLASQPQLTGRLHAHGGEGREGPSSLHITDGNGNKHTWTMQEGYRK